MGTGEFLENMTLVDWPAIVILILVMLLGFGLLELSMRSVWYAKRLRLRKRKMGNDERRLELRRIICDGFTDCLEDLEYRGKITRDEKMCWYKKFADKFGLLDLLPAPRNDKKGQIKARLDRGHGKPVKLPGDVPVKVPDMGDILIAKLKGAI